MDIFSHGLYGGAAFGRKSKKDYLIAFLFGIGPDLIAFGPYFLYLLFGYATRPTGFEDFKGHIPLSAHYLYNYTHSFIIYGIFFALMWIILGFYGKRNFLKLTLGWPLHILVDIPVHSLAFFPTPFLWPISNYHVNGIPWSEPYIFIPNILLVVGIYLYWFLKRKANK